MIGQNIKRLRLENNMTQKNLADRLFVTAQAVSRWENGDVEPSLNTVAELARIFGVSTDEILGVADANREFEQDFAEEEYAEESDAEEEQQRAYTESHEQRRYYEERPQMLALCEKCNNPIYKPEDIFRYRDDQTGAKCIRCRACEIKFRKMVADRANKFFAEDKAKKLKKARRGRAKNIVLACFFVALFIYWSITNEFSFDLLLGALIWQCMLGTIFFRNTKFGRMLCKITLWHEFSDADLGMLNLVIWVIDIAIILASGLVAFVVGAVTGPIFYTFAIIRNIKSPDRVMLDDFWWD